MERMYEIKIVEDKKLIYATASGTFKEENSKNYLSDFQTVLNTINPRDYNLIVDATKLEVDNSLNDDMKFVLNIYTYAKFKRMIVVNPDALTSKLHILEIAKKLEYPGMFVDKIEEAFSVI